MWDTQGAIDALTVVEFLIEMTSMTSVAVPLGASAAVEFSDGAAVHAFPVDIF